MRSALGDLFGQFGHILGICPCCDELFRLADAHPYLKRKHVRSALDDLEDEEGRISRAIERLDEGEEELRVRARFLGQRAAKRRLRKMDPTFSGSGLDPQDVKTIFDPVEYVIFDGMNGGKTRRVVLMAHAPESRDDEALLRSIEQTVENGNFLFKTLRVLADGKIEMK